MLWPNRDPIEENGDINLYRFAQNEPVEHVDALGLQIVLPLPRPWPFPPPIPYPSPSNPDPRKRYRHHSDDPPQAPPAKPLPNRACQATTGKLSDYNAAKRKCIDKCSDEALPTKDYGATLDFTRAASSTWAGQKSKFLSVISYQLEVQGAPDGTEPRSLQHQPNNWRRSGHSLPQRRYPDSLPDPAVFPRNTAMQCFNLPYAAAWPNSFPNDFHDSS
jgi:hypothetical protein